MKIGSNKALELVNVSLDDAGNYFCTLDNDANAVKTRINIQVKSEFIIVDKYLYF